MTLAIASLDLTPRQRRVVELRLRHLGRREIAERLGISPRGVRKHLDEARRSNGLEDEVDLLLAADRQWRAEV
jgi:DNA-binding CsgD family transcriptional regulator